MGKPLSILLVVLALVSSLNASSSNIDSLVQCLGKAKSDSTRFQLLTQIASAYSDSNYRKSLDYFTTALEVAEKLDERKHLGDTYHKIGFCYERMGEFTSALKNYNNAADIYTHLNDQKNLAGVFNDIGLIYRNWGKYDRALESYLKAQKIFDETLDIEGSAMVANSIGQIYFYQENHAKAIEFFMRYYNINASMGNPRAVAGAANNIASAYLELKKHDEALNYYLQALRIYDSLDIRVGVGIIRDNIGSLFYAKQQYDDALLYHKNALKIFRELDSPMRISSTLKNMASVYIKQGRNLQAIESLNESLALAKKAGQRSEEKNIYQTLAEAHHNNGDFSQAYKYLELHTALKDSVLNAETVETIERLQAEYNAERKQNEINSINRQLRIQQQILIAFGIFFAVLLLLTLLLLRENHAKKRAFANVEQLKTDIMNRLSTTCNNMDVFRHDTPLDKTFTDSWHIAPDYEESPRLYMLHFKVQDYIFAYTLIIKNPDISHELINLTVFNFVTEFFKTNTEDVFNLNKAIAQQLLNDPLTSTYLPEEYQIVPLLITQNRVLALTSENLAVEQQGSLIIVNDCRAINLNSNDTLYIYDSIGPNCVEDRKSVRKIFKTITQFEFGDQRDIAINYLKSIEIDDSTIIFALKV
ncbi:MAG: tetratricopeptide repeat protein [Bacteroidales bacterium]|nr:tetratricopeptide repeat protein [Bacteroidales bacterium]